MDDKQQEIDHSEITDFNLPFVIEWLNDRSSFHQWFSSIITGSFIVVSIFGKKPSFDEVSGIVLSVAILLFLFALICNLVCVWSIPGWKYRISAKILSNSYSMRMQLSITAWLGVISFVSGLTLSVIGNSV